MSPFPGFTARRIDGDGVTIHTVTGGSGSPVLLLHGYPQTHACWHAVAPLLAERHAVVCPDLRGYGASDKPAGGACSVAYSKRAMARDMVAVMRALGHERFVVAGHDRGGRVAYRMALDHPDVVARLALLDIVPTLETWERMGRGAGVGAYHWYFLAQPRGFPERLIGFDPEGFLRHTLASWAAPGFAFDDRAMDAYIRAFRDPATIQATCEDYRAGAGLDAEIDAADRTAGRRIACPVLALWGARDPLERGWDFVTVWRAWAGDVRGGPVTSGHFLPEEAPRETAERLLGFMAA